MASAAAMTRGARMVVSDLETRWGLRYTADTLLAVKARFAGVRFVWVMGADNLSQFHRWRRWGAVFHAAPVAVFPRPGARARASASMACQRFAGARRAGGPADPCLVHANPPAWVVLTAPLVGASSTALRARGVEA